MVHQGLFELNGSIDELTRHIAELEQMAPVSDPRVQESMDRAEEDGANGLVRTALRPAIAAG
jgi:hypothetical protein